MSMLCYFVVAEEIGVLVDFLFVVLSVSKKL
jgi:hypothetical protein